MGQKQNKGEDRRSNRTGQNNQTADRKKQSKDSTEIPYRGETSKISGLFGEITSEQPENGNTNIISVIIICNC